MTTAVRAAVGAGIVTALLGASAAAAPRRTTVFLDFGGGIVGPGTDASLDQAGCVTDPFEFPIFLGSERASELAVAEARRILAPYGVTVVAERPPDHLPYTRVRIGGEAGALGLDPKLNGLACDVDCDDQFHRDAVFMFSDKWVSSAALAELDEDQLAVQVGRISVHEVGHAWGLEHTGGSGSVMARFPSTTEPSFVVGCELLDLDTDSECPSSRARHCAAGQQDAHAELLAMFGPGDPDDSPPHAEIVWPPDGHVVAPGDTVQIEVEVGDDYEGFGWKLEVPQLEWEWVARQADATPPALVIPEGAWTLRLEALDHDRNVGEASVLIEARVPTEAEDESSTPSAACACRTDPRPGLGWWALWMVVAVRGLAFTRRRSSTGGTARPAPRHPA
ncbi:MAG: hypothetical protein K0V04_42510 [Deltaproteobacteria bacterium]|nr:hypothetical protein [Deltaproteobacteria bacterium]